MTFACIVATQFNFNVKDDQTEVDQTVEANELNIRNQVNSGHANQTQTQFNQSSHQATSQENANFLNGKKRKFEFLEKLQSGVFAQRFSKRPEWYSLFKSITNIKLVALISLAWFMGTGVGLVFTFLFWHLQVRFS